MTESYEIEPDDDPLPAAGYRTYEVFQRERVGETTNLLKPKELIGDEMLADPYRLLTVLRENSPCYRDWKSNRFWITRYDDVTSVFTDDANFESRSKRWTYGIPDRGRDLGHDITLLWSRAHRIDAHLVGTLDRILADLAAADAPDLATGVAARLPLELWGAVLDIPMADLGEFSARLWRMERGAGWESRARDDGLAAFDELVSYIDPLLATRRREPGTDLISAAARLDLGGGPATAEDVVATILEADHQTLHGGLANLWFQLLTHPDQLDVIREDRRLVKFAWLEALRHSPPVQSAQRFTRHEVERFGRLLPTGALLWCSAAAANRDPRVFDEPERFQVERMDLCQREPRGHYRADGLPSGIAFGLGAPSVHPAVPKERPRSNYAITRDVAVTASLMLLDRWATIRLADGAEPTLRSLRLGEMFTCWGLPVTW
jgi:pulcherriminic acid synthase